jgi:RimJ/RimL family protein N-acetyltransferase
MGVIVTTELEIEDGRSVLLASAVPEEAAELLDYVDAVLRESDHFLTLPEEFSYTVDQEAELVRNATGNPAELVLVARAQGAIIGSLMLLSDHRSRMAHTSTMHISVRESWRGRGVGTALMETLIQWAEENPLLEKLCLSAFSSNSRATKLYSRMGFVEEGRRIKQYKLAPGEYADEVLMARFVN